METITIPYEKFEELLDKASMLDAILHDITYIIEEANPTYDKDDVRLDDDFRLLAKKYCQKQLKNKIYEIKKESEKKENE